MSEDTVKAMTKKSGLPTSTSASASASASISQASAYSEAADHNLAWQIQMEMDRDPRALAYFYAAHGKEPPPTSSGKKKQLKTASAGNVRKSGDQKQRNTVKAIYASTLADLTHSSTSTVTDTSSGLPLTPGPSFENTSLVKSSKFMALMAGGGSPVNPDDNDDDDQDDDQNDNDQDDDDQGVAEDDDEDEDENENEDDQDDDEDDEYLAGLDQEEDQEENDDQYEPMELEDGTITTRQLMAQRRRIEQLEQLKARADFEANSRLSLIDDRVYSPAQMHERRLVTYGKLAIKI